MADLLHRIQPVFAFDFEDIFASGGVNYLRDFGPNGLHAAFPGGADDPAVITGGLTLDATDYLSLPLAFYDYAPTGEHTWFAVFRPTHDDAVTRRIFSCRYNDAGTHHGISLVHVGQNDRTMAWCNQATGAGIYLGENVTRRSYLQRPCVVCISVQATPVASINRWVGDMAWLAGAYGAPSYYATATPNIGMDSDGSTDPLGGDLFYLALVSQAIPLGTLLDFGNMLSDGRKPWCERAV
jgi:hypothetical protein